MVTRPSQGPYPHIGHVLIEHAPLIKQSQRVHEMIFRNHADIGNVRYEIDQVFIVFGERVIVFDEFRMVVSLLVPNPDHLPVAGVRHAMLHHVMRD